MPLGITATNSLLITNMQQTTLINIDYLIINLVGTPFLDFPQSSNFSTIHYDYGTKIFKERFDLYYKNEKIGTYSHSPRSTIIDSDLCQLQFENHLFYTKSLHELQSILSEFCDETLYEFKSINRLDIAIDRNDSNNFYRNLHSDILNGNKLISGRTKALQSFHETFKGSSVLNGYTIGKRSSAKMLRIYNKTLSLQLNEKPFINEFYKNNNLQNQNVWRFEFQLNSKFFQDLKEHSKFNFEISQRVTWGIFDKITLIELFKMAQDGFFEIHQNTGKSQINKEVKEPIFDFNQLQNCPINHKPVISKLKKIFVSSLTIKKRLAKSLFREYYSNSQDLSYIVALNLLLENVNVATDKKLFYWFQSKMTFYLNEFRNKEKIIKTFDFELFHEHQTYFL